MKHQLNYATAAGDDSPRWYCRCRHWSYLAIVAGTSWSQRRAEAEESYRAHRYPGGAGDGSERREA